jgi:hypothetical protein
MVAVILQIPELETMLLRGAEANGDCFLFTSFVLLGHDFFFFPATTQPGRRPVDVALERRLSRFRRRPLIIAVV